MVVGSLHATCATGHEAARGKLGDQYYLHGVLYRPSHLELDAILEQQDALQRKQAARRALERQTTEALVSFLGKRAEVHDGAALEGRRGVVIGGSAGLLHLHLDDNGGGKGGAPSERGDGCVGERGGRGAFRAAIASARGGRTPLWSMRVVPHSRASETRGERERGWDAERSIPGPPGG